MSVSPSVSAPAQVSGTPRTPTQADLLDFVRRTAADAELIASLPLDPEGRTWVRLEGPGGSEAWLIGWPPGTGTGWHDHADSVGAFLTAAGELKENSLAARLPTDGWKTLELTEDVDRERRLPAGQGRGFGRHHVHEVLNESRDRARDLGPRLLSATAPDPPLQPYGTGAAAGARRAPAGLAVSEQPVGIDELLDRVRETYARVETQETLPRPRRPAKRCWWTSGTRLCASATA